MRKLQIIRVDNDLVQKADLQIGNNIIGRGPTTGCNDEKLIKHAVTINLSPSGDMTLIPVTSCYMKPVGSTRWQLLELGTSVPLKPGDTFSLLPDKCWFKVRSMPERMEENNHALKRKGGEEHEGPPPEKKICPDPLTKIMSHGDNLNEFQNIKDLKHRTEEQSTPNRGDHIDVTTVHKEKYISSLTGTELTTENLHTNEESQNEEENRTTAENNEITDTSTKHIIEETTEDNDTHPSDHDESNFVIQDAATSSSCTKKVKGNAQTTNVQKQSKRNICRYGEKCYRRSVNHKVQFSHPGDPDYDTFDDRPECPYGARCYRKNPKHKAEFKHSSRMQIRRAPTPIRKKSPVYFSESEPSSEEEESIDESEYVPSEDDITDDNDDWEEDVVDEEEEEEEEDQTEEDRED